jgi:hypothetical protein
MQIAVEAYAEDFIALDFADDRLNRSADPCNLSLSSMLAITSALRALASGWGGSPTDQVLRRTPQLELARRQADCARLVDQLQAP